MTHNNRCSLAMALSVVSLPGLLTGQTTRPEAFSASNSVPAAFVYVQTRDGVIAYNASSAVRLTLIKGSPFGTSGQMAGDNGGYLISTGTDYIHSYKVESNGAIGGQASEINTQSYGGADCGTTDGQGAILDHSGKYFYVQLYGATYEDGGETYVKCSAWQSYKISSSGQFTFLGDQVSDYGYHGDAFSVPVNTIGSNDKFAYGSFGDVYASQYDPFTINSNGELVTNNKFTETDPTPGGPDGNYYPVSMAADPSGHLAVAVFEYFAQNPPPAQLASYTINSGGGITSTNTYADMPTPALTYCCGVMSMSTSGKLVAVTGSTGMQVFHFNGASPITALSSVLLPSETVKYISWDNSNHMYALASTGATSFSLHVFNATSTSLAELTGSPYSVSNVYGLDALIVVPK